MADTVEAVDQEVKAVSTVPERRRRANEGRNARPRAEVDPNAAQQSGIVVSRHGTYGFVRSGRDRLFFHISDVDPACAEHLGPDWQVRFRMGRDPLSGRQVAVQVTGHPPRPAQKNLPEWAEESRAPLVVGLHRDRHLRTPGTVSGVIHQAARGPQAAKLDDGIILFAEEDDSESDAGAHHQAIYGTYSLAAGEPLPEEGDVVEFELVSNPVTLSRKAINIRVLERRGSPAPATPPLPSPSPPPPSGPCLGRVSSVKKEFGFIRQLHSMQDIFFHFSQLTGGLTREDIVPGLQVEYEIGRGREGPPAAQQVRRAPAGSVVFETLGGELLDGVVLQRPRLGGNPGVMRYGAVAGEGGPGAPAPGRILLFPGDVPRDMRLRNGDVLRFRVLTDLRAAAAAGSASTLSGALMAGRRAVQVSYVRIAGRILSVNADRGFGFVGKLRCIGDVKSTLDTGKEEEEQSPNGGEKEEEEGDSDAAAVSAANEQQQPSEESSPNKLAVPPPTCVGLPSKLYFSMREVILESGEAPSEQKQEQAPLETAVTADDNEEAGVKQGPSGVGDRAAVESSTPSDATVPPSASRPPPLRVGDEVEGVLYVSQRAGEPSVRMLIRVALAPPEPEPRPHQPRPRPAFLSGPKRQVEEARRQPLGPPSAEATGFELARTVEAVPPILGFQLMKKPAAPAPSASANITSASLPKNNGKNRGKGGQRASAGQEDEPMIQRRPSAAALDMAAALDATEFVPGSKTDAA